MKTSGASKSQKRLRFLSKAPVAASEDILLIEQLLKKRFNIHWLGENFRRLFLNKLLKGTPAKNLVLHQLAEKSTNQQIKDELGEGAIFPLAHLLSLVEKQRNGGAGPLLTNGNTNLVIVEMEGSVWFVLVSWDSYYGGWIVEARPVGDPYKWRAGRHVISC